MNKGMMLRVKACAEIAKVDKAEKIEAIAETMDGDIDGASIRYVLGALKAGIRRGTYRTYEDALDAFERAQVGDRGQSLAMPSPLERTVRHINYINQLPSTQWERDLLARKGIEVKATKSHARNMAKVMGQLYVQWEDCETMNTVQYAIDADERDARIVNTEKHIAAYVREYIGRLSPTAQKAVREIVESAYTAETICKAERDADAERIRNKANYLHRGFPARDALSAREFVDVLKKYA